MFRYSVPCIHAFMSEYLAKQKLRSEQIQDSQNVQGSSQRLALENGGRMDGCRSAGSQKNNSGSLLKLMRCACAAAGTKTERLPPGVCVGGLRGRVTDGW